MSDTVEANIGTYREPATTSRSASFWPTGWWRLMDYKIGIISLPIYVILVGLLAILTQQGQIKPDAPTMIAVLVLGGFTCAELGRRLPVLRNIGAAAIFATFIPSALVYYKLIPAPIEKSISPSPRISSMSISQPSSSAASSGWTATFSSRDFSRSSCRSA